MPKINTYAIDGTVTNNDKVIGTDTATGETKNYLVSDIVALAGGGGGGAIGGTIANTQVAFGTGVNTISGDAAFTYNSTDDVLTTEGHVLTPQVANPEITNPLTNLWINIENGHLYRGNRDTESTVHFNVRNDEGVTIPLGAPLYSRGEIGGSNRVLVGIADASDANKMPAIGIAMEELNTTSTKDGNAIATGILNEDINSFTGLTNNKVLYVAAHGGTWSTVADLITPTKPTGTTHLVQNVGICIRHTGGVTMKGFNVAAIGRVNDTPNTISTSGNITSLLNIEGASIIKTGGTSSQLLKADGSVGSINNLTETGSSILTITGGAGSVIGSGTTIQVTQASSLNNGYLSSTDWITFNSKLTALIDDTSPRLGGNLDTGNAIYSIISQSGSNANINITPDGTGAVVLDGLSYPTADGGPGEVLTTNGLGVLSFAAQNPGTVTSVSGTGTAGGLTLTGTVTSSGSLTLGGSLDISTDASPQLGGQLDANTNSITNAFVFQGDQFQAILNTLTAGTIIWDTSNGVYAELSLSTNSTLDIANLGVGTPAVLKVTQSVGSNNITSYTVAGGLVKWSGGVAPTISPTSGRVDIITFVSDGTDIYASIAQNFS